MEGRHAFPSAWRRAAILRTAAPHANVTQRILSKALRELEADGLILRTVYPTVPPQVGYRLTEKGAALRPAILALRAWGQQDHLKGTAQRPPVETAPAMGRPMSLVPHPPAMTDSLIAPEDGSASSSRN